MACVVVPAEKDGLRRELLPDSLNRFEKFSGTSSFKICAATIAYEEGIAGEREGLFTLSEKADERARTVSWSFEVVNGRSAELGHGTVIEALAPFDRLDTRVWSLTKAPAVLCADEDFHVRESCEKAWDSCDMIKVRMGEKNLCEGQLLALDRFQQGLEVLLWVDHECFASR